MLIFFHYIYEGFKTTCSVMKAWYGLIQLRGRKIRQQLLKVAVCSGGIVYVLKILWNLVGQRIFDKNISTPGIPAICLVGNPTITCRY